MNNKGQLQSTVLAVFLVFAIGIVVFFFGDVFFRLFTELNVAVTTNPAINSTLTAETTETAVDLYATAWDYVTVAVMIGILISLITTAFLTRISPAFYWIYILFGIIIVIAGSMFSVLWQTITEQSIYADAVTRYPMTDAILGNNFILIAVSLFVILAIIFIFGKGGGSDEVR